MYVLHVRTSPSSHITKFARFAPFREVVGCLLAALQVYGMPPTSLDPKLAYLQAVSNLRPQFKKDFEAHQQRECICSTHTRTHAHAIRAHICARTYRVHTPSYSALPQVTRNRLTETSVARVFLHPQAIAIS